MSGTHVLTLLTHTERRLLVALLEKSLRTLREVQHRTADTSASAEIREHMSTTVTLLNKLHATWHDDQEQK